MTRFYAIYFKEGVIRTRAIEWSVERSITQAAEYVENPSSGETLVGIVEEPILRQIASGVINLKDLITIPWEP